MAERAVDFRDRLHAFLVTDDQARWKAIGWTLGVGGVLGSIDLTVLDATVDDAVLFMTVVTMVSLICWISWFCVLKPLSQGSPTLHFQPRRTFVQAGLSALGMAVTASFPQLEAKALNSKLEEALKALDSNSEGVLGPRGAIAQANDAIETANQVKIRLRSANKYAEKMIVASARPQLQDLAWKGTQLALTQKTFVNSDFEPPLPDIQDRDWVAQFKFPGPASGIMKWRGKWVNSDQGAQPYIRSMNQIQTLAGPQSLNISS
jgi:hypothetical protein